MKIRLAGAVAVAAIAGSLLLLTAGAPLIWPDQTIPAPYSEQIDQARSSVRGQVEGLRFPHFQLVEIRCGANGAVAYVFDQIEAPYIETRYAYAVTGTWPPSGWSGGITLTTRDDTELAYLLGTEVPCKGS